jgi:hypothetical protein
LIDLNVDMAIPARRSPQHPVLAWAESGAMALTGHRGSPARICPIPLASAADGALLALEAITGHPLSDDFGGSRLLGERAAIAGYARNGSISPGGSCRFVQSADDWLAINLTRQEDWELVPALLERDIPADWSAVTAAIRDERAKSILSRGRELGLAIGHHDPEEEAGPWHCVLHRGSRNHRRRDRPLVIDLSSLWAGPLCSQLLQLLGARVIKVESVARPDGARFGPARFFDVLNGGKESVALDLSNVHGRARLRSLLAKADIVIEASRPRALRQLGIRAEELISDYGLIWISINGYGREGETANWIAYGDDAGVSAGASAFLVDANGAPIFCGDAIADPLTGLHAALAAWAHWRDGAGGLVSVSLRDVTANCIALDRPASWEAAAARAAEWQAVLSAHGGSVERPTARQPRTSARSLGADTNAVLSELGIPC